MKPTELIQNLTGISRQELDEIFKEVKRNSALLESCQRHDFSICLDRRTKEPIDNPTPQQRVGARWKCTKCGGVVDGIHRIWYDRGIADATHP